ncbi:hypothetical protein SAMN05216428_105140 [Nitrosospira sp. Nsp11]|uniref:carboxypeptidase regulatory-like domain-containing protein n=1 Tax=Nitrosospira sp. Nsp11 TaxID=1855338 RepID=UPI00091584A8|nr:carboxypeptidase regulatory-like domain-containing protein [Nitrosospira sp. Nsp11]SHL72690.1 hypothetical protein SAMN05216428_105140 [Nitrosospira sp. Nsp11]
MKRTEFTKAGLALTFLAVFSTCGFAESDNLSPSTSLPPTRSQGHAEFLSGGIGGDESDAIKKAAISWPLMLELAQTSTPRAEYISDVPVTISDESGKIVLDTVAEGPFLLIKLPPGKYSLAATYQSIKLYRQLNIQKGQHEKLTLIWPAIP